MPYPKPGPCPVAADCAAHPQSPTLCITDGPKIMDWYVEGKVSIDDLVNHTMPLEDINKGFDLMKSG